MQNTSSIPARSGGRIKFLIAGGAILAAVVFLIVTSLPNTAQYFYTVGEIQAKSQSLAGKNLRASGVVLGNTIQVESKTLKISFEMADISNDMQTIEKAGGLAAALHAAASDTKAPRLKVVYIGPRPDLLKNEAQAIVTGKLGADGVFYADELLLKCPARYDAQFPDQVQNPGS